MSVPSSGSLSMHKMAKEKLYDDYNSSTPIIGIMALSDMVQGGNINGSNFGPGEYFDETDTGSPSYPSSTPPYRFSDWYGYDHDYTPVFADAIQTSSRLYIPSHSATKPYEQWSFYQQNGSWYANDTDPVITGITQLAPLPWRNYLGQSGYKNFYSGNTPSNWYISQWYDSITGVGLNRRNRIMIAAVSTPNWSYNYVLYTKTGYKFANLSTSSINITVTTAYTNSTGTIASVYFIINNTGLTQTLGSAILNIDFDIEEI